MQGSRKSLCDKIVVPRTAGGQFIIFSESVVATRRSELAQEMLKICKQRLPVVFDSSGPKRVALGYCPEGGKVYL